MKIEFTHSFIIKLDTQIEFIAKDKPSAARKFKKEILDECKSLADTPHRCRKSIHFEDESIRDMVFKGYTAIYKVFDEKIVFFALTKYENYGKGK
jgi:plasmid stabilization system protein ParE